MFYTKAMKLFMALCVCVLLTATTAHAGGYLSDYGHGGGTRYLNSYGSGSYSPPSGSSWNYGGPNGGTETPHRASWQAYKRAKQQQNMANISPAGGPAWNIHLQNTWASRQYVAWTGHYPRGFSNVPCGNYQRAPAGCRATTTPYNPYLHDNF